jgi:hypothetical protein
MGHILHSQVDKVVDTFVHTIFFWNMSGDRKEILYPHRNVSDLKDHIINLQSLAEFFPKNIIGSFAKYPLKPSHSDLYLFPSLPSHSCISVPFQTSKIIKMGLVFMNYS